MFNNSSECCFSVVYVLNVWKDIVLNNVSSKIEVKLYVPIVGKIILQILAVALRIPKTLKMAVFRKKNSDSLI